MVSQNDDSIKNKMSRIFFAIVLVVSAIITSTPKLAEGKYYIVDGILAISCVIANWNTKTFGRNLPLVISVFLFLFLIYTYKLLAISSVEWGFYVEFSLFFIMILLMPLIPQKLTDRQALWTWWLMIAVFFLNIGYNICIKVLFPEIQLMVGTENADFLKNINIGISSFFNTILFFFMACFFIYQNSTKKSFKYLVFSCVIVTAIYICFYTLKASVVIYCILSIGLLVFAKKLKKGSVFIKVYIVIGLMSVLLLRYYADSLINNIIEISPNERLTGRLVALVDADNDEANDASLVERSELWLVSIDTWLSNPINFLFGIGDHREERSTTKTAIGQHSDFLDSLAKFGLIGGYLIFVMLKRAFNYLLALFGRQYRLQLIMIFVVFILMGLTKRIFTSGIGTCMFLLLPLAARCLKIQTK